MRRHRCFFLLLATAIQILLSDCTMNINVTTATARDHPGSAYQQVADTDTPRTATTGHR